VDMMIFSGWREDSAVGLDAFYSAYQKGLVSDAIIDKAYQRIINLKNKL